MQTWKPIAGLSFQPAEFKNYCHSLRWDAWRPSFIVLHNTVDPSLSDRPNGLTKQNILDLEAYYRDTKKWSAGPHLFVDDHQIWVFTPLTTSGVHSPSWNKVSWGVEMLGDYNKDEFDNGRGLAVQKNAVAALEILFSTLGIEITPLSLRLHKEDPLTTHTYCPGKSIIKEDILKQVSDALIADNSGEHIVAV